MKTTKVEDYSEIHRSKILQILRRFVPMRRGQNRALDIFYFTLGCLTFVLLTNCIVNYQLDYQSYHELSKRVEFLQASLSQAQSRMEELSCSVQQIGTRGAFCLTPQSLDVGGNWIWDVNLTLALEGLFESKNVGDFGAGLGWYGRFFLRMNKRVFDTVGNKTEDENFFLNKFVMTQLKKPQRLKGWKGYDGAAFVRQMTKGLVQHLDLSEQVWLPDKFDWVMSLEVGEHIPALYQHNFIDNLVRHAREGVVLSWAVPGQGGHHHVNEQTNHFVKTQFLSRGFQPDMKWERVLRRAAIFEWFKSTVMVFRRITDKNVNCKK